MIPGTLPPVETEPLQQEAQLLALLAHSPMGCRALDRRLALVLGWESREEGAWWRRYRLSWSRADNLGVPPRYTTSLDRLLAELPPHWAVTLTIRPGRCVAQVWVDGLDDLVTAVGGTIELALAGALARHRMQAGSPHSGGRA